MGMGPIPWSAVGRYAAHRGLNRTETNVLQLLIRMMDNAYLEKQSGGGLTANDMTE